MLRVALSHEVLLAALLLTLSQLFGLATPYLVKLVIDEAIAPGRPDLLWTIGAAGLLLYALTSATRFWGKWLTDKCGEELWLDLRNRLFQHLQGLSLHYHRSRRIGELLSRVHSDTYQIKQLITSAMPGIISLLIGVGGTGIILFVLAPKLTLLALIPLPVAAVIAWMFRNRIRPLSRKKMELHSELYTTLQESLSGIEEIKIYGGEEQFANRLDAQGRELKDVQLQLSRDQAKLFPLVDFAISTVLLGALVAGGHMVIADTLSIGTLVVFYYYIARSLGPIRSASAIVFAWYGGTAAIERISELLESDERLPRAEEPLELPTPPVAIAFDKVTFDYHDPASGKRFRALDDVSLIIPPNARVAILGPSGSGKSTTGKLLARLFDPDDGSIRVNELPMTHVAVDDLRRQIGYVGQEVFLFNGSIEENIRFGTAQASDQDVARVVRLARVDELLERKPDGLQSIVGEKGARLSGGQKKRIALARALLRRPTLLIIDQLASDLEEDLNRSIFENIEQECELAVLYLGHRIPAGFRPDAIYWMEHGHLNPRVVDVELTDDAPSVATRQPRPD